MIQYENIFSVKNKHYERVFDTETKKSHFNEISIEPKVYVPDKNGKYTYFLDKTIKLSEKKFQSISDMNNQTKTMKESKITYFGKTTAKYQYLKEQFYFNNNEYVNNDHDMRTWYIDIEVSQEFGFPFPYESKAPVTLIQLYDNFDDKYYVIGYKKIDGLEDIRNISKCKESNLKYEFPENTVYLQVNSEVEMFNYFFKLIKSKQPTIWTAWNGAQFDFPYLVRRCENIGLNSGNLSPVHNSTYSFRDDVYSVDISGIYLLDLMELYKKFTFTPQTSYSLNNISKEELGAEKVVYEEYSNLDDLMEKDYPTFVRYGIVDTQLIRWIDKKLNLINLVKSIAYKMGICLDDALGTVKPWGTYITNVAYQEGFILPNDGLSNDYDGIKGAWVATPEVGKWSWVLSFDWASLYPSIIRWCNFSPETFIPRERLPEELKWIADNILKDDEDYLIENLELFEEKVKPMLKKYNVSAGINGSFYQRDVIGLIPRLIKQLYAERKSDKKTMFKYTQMIQDLKHNGGSEEEIKEAENMESFWDTAQMTKKILLNSLYGALGNQYFVLFNPAIASAITGNGRYTNKTMAVSVSNMLQTKIGSRSPYLIYGDTDSVVGDTIITLSDGYKKIEDLYNNTDGVLECRGNDNFVKRPYKEIMACSMNKNQEVEYKPINYIMAHKVNKRMFKVTVNGDSVVITEDHSIIILRNNEMISGSVRDIVHGDKIIKII